MLSNRFYGPKDYAKAIGICTLNFPGMLASMESDTTSNKVIALMEYMGIVFNDAEMFKGTQHSSNKNCREITKTNDDMDSPM